MKINLKQKSWLIYVIPMFAAALVRIVFFFNWLDSPFRYYHILYGLDMRKFLVWGELFYTKQLPFSMYKFFVGTIYLISGKENLPVAVVIVQMVLGVLISGLTVYVFLHLFRNKKFAVLAGIFTATYAPFLIYESQILKETLFLFLCFSAITSIIALRKNKFSGTASFFTGMSIIAPFYIRFSGLLLGILMVFWIFLYLLKNKKSFKPLIPILIGSLTLVAIISLYNLKNNRSNSIYFHPNTDYILKVGKQPNILSLSFHGSKEATYSNSDYRLSDYILHYLGKSGVIFSGYEQPNNINYYFMKEKIPFLKLLPGPMIFIPLSVAGMILLILNFRQFSRISILLLYMLSFILPMFLFLPLARYKIILAPLFSVFAAYYLFYVITRTKNQKKDALLKPLIILLLTLLFSVYFCNNLPQQRDDDVKAYGITATLIPKQLIENGKFKKAEIILEKYYNKNRENPYIVVYYVSSLLGTGQPEKAEKILQQVLVNPIDEPSLIGDYFYEFAECSYLLGKKYDALNYYNIAIKYPISKQRITHSMKRIKKLTKGQQ